MLYDCTRYWSAIFRGVCKLELTFCLGWKTRYFFKLSSELIYLNKAIHKLLAVQSLFAVAIKSKSLPATVSEVSSANSLIEK